MLFRLKFKFQSLFKGLRYESSLVQIYFLRGGDSPPIILISNFLCVTMIINLNILRIFQYFPILFFDFLLPFIVFHYLPLFFYYFISSSIIFCNFSLYFIIIHHFLKTFIYLYYILSYVSILQRYVFVIISTVDTLSFVLSFMDNLIPMVPNI